MNNMPGEYLSSKEVRHPNTLHVTENEKWLNKKYVRQKHDVTNICTVAICNKHRVL